MVQLLSLVYALAAVIATTAVVCYLVAVYLERKYTCVHDIKHLGKERKAGEKAPHAVVLGGGLGGILSARVLLDHFEHVTVVEGDELEKDGERIRGAVSQGTMPSMLHIRRIVVMPLLHA